MPTGRQQPTQEPGRSPTAAWATRTTPGRRRPRSTDNRPHEEPDSRIDTIIPRGHADSSIDPTINVERVEQLLWAALYAAAHAPAMTSLTESEARAQVLQSLLKPVAADPAGV